jgi:plasmid segregation protein ParM
MSELVLGVDVGFGNTKSANSIFSSGVTKHKVMPPINTKVLETTSGIYSVGHPKNTIQESKTIDETTLVLTEAAIAEEMKRLDITRADIHLGVGVPLTRMGAEKQPLIDYYTKNRRLCFKYEGIPYSINLLSVNVFPQGYAGVVNYMKSFNKVALVIDMGSWTVDILPLKEGQPDLSQCKSLPLGTITCMHTINENLRESFNGEADEIHLKEVMITGTSNELPDKYLKVIRDGLYTYVDSIMGQLRALQFNLDTTQLIFVGGGATIIKHFLDTNKYPNASIIDDVFINAKGYENLIRFKIRQGKI